LAVLLCCCRICAKGINGCREAIAGGGKLVQAYPWRFESSVDSSREREVVRAVVMDAHEEAASNKQAAGM